MQKYFPSSFYCEPIGEDLITQQEHFPSINLLQIRIKMFLYDQDINFIILD